MKERILLQKLIAGGWTQAKLADRLSTTQQTISRWLTGENEPRGPAKLAIRDLAMEEGLTGEPPARTIVPIMGKAGAGGDIEPDFEQVPEDGIEQIELPATAAIASSQASDPIGFRVVGDSMYPRFSDGDILIVERDQPWSTDSMIGDQAVVLAYDEEGRSRRYVKRIMPGKKKGTFNLESIDREVPTLRDCYIRWASPVRVIIPNIGRKRIARTRRKSDIGGGKEQLKARR